MYTKPSASLCQGFIFYQGIFLLVPHVAGLGSGQTALPTQFGRQGAALPLAGHLAGYAVLPALVLNHPPLLRRSAAVQALGPARYVELVVPAFSLALLRGVEALALALRVHEVVLRDALIAALFRLERIALPLALGIRLRAIAVAVEELLVLLEEATGSTGPRP